MRSPFVDDIMMLALTVWGEARGESAMGKLGVAYVWANRAEIKKRGMSHVVFQPLQASFWNSNDPSRPTISDIDPNSPVWEACYKAAALAFFKLAPDPTHGANHYLNLTAVKRIPSWYDPKKVTTKIERHTFLKL